MRTCVALLAAAALAAPAAAQPLSTCFWAGPANPTVNPAMNVAYPDTGATYWYARFALPAGAHLVLHCRYAQARYQSLDAYAAGGTPVDALNDLATAPDPGSVNPFVAGARRTGRFRSYTVQVVNLPTPADPSPRAPNTLYLGGGGPTQEMLYRVYVPNRGRDLAGGTGLPDPTVVLADGSQVAGDAACDLLGSRDPTLPAGVTLPLSVYESLIHAPGNPDTFPSTDPPTFEAFYNTAYALSLLTGNRPPDPVRVGGFYSNVDNNYVSAATNRKLGPVLVLRGTLPTTPKTFRKRRTMTAGQLRYWSICGNESPVTTAVTSCLYDEQLHLDALRRYTVVVARPEDRPRNAVAACRADFLPWSPNGDGVGDPDRQLLIVRNMLPAPDFHQSVFDTRTPGDEAAVMGPYLPVGTYTTKEAFEALGCRR